jgi:hypothetical protein
MMNYPVKSRFSPLGTLGVLAVKIMFKNNKKTVDW